MKPFAIAVVFALATAGCSSGPPEEQIRLAVEQIQSGKPGEKPRARLEKLAKAGNVQAALHLGDLLSEGKYFKTEPSLACGYYEQASATDARAMNQVGKCWERGVTGTKNPVNAVASYEKAITMGSTTAKCELGALLIRGVKPNPSDPERGQKLCAEAAAAGNHAAAVKLGSIYMNGDGLKKDAAKARALFQHAADAGDGDAALWLGSMYGNGQGMPKDMTQAIRWWGVAFDHGKIEGAKFIGDDAMAKALRGDKAALDVAIEWYEKALTKNPTGSTRGQIEGNLTQARKLKGA